MKQHYILFDSQSSGMKLRKVLNEKEIRAVVVPTPRELSASCGIALLISEKDIDLINKLVKERKLEIKGIYTLERD